jgi:N-acetylmuramoyl-L-alanine amidase
MFWRFLICSVCCSTALATASPLVVMLDPGHGGKDQGTAHGAVHEADITLEVSQRLRERLARDARFQVLMTRQEDTAVSLYRRAQMAKNKKVDLFLSIHVNSSPDARARGAEFYFQNQLPPDQESMYLAHQENISESGEEVQPITYDFQDQNNYPAEVMTILTDLLDNQRVLRSSELSTALKSNWRGTRKSKANSVRQAPFYVLLQMRSPSALVELGFLTNNEDYAELTNHVSQNKMADDLYRGLVTYKESLDKARHSP